jgi:two-component system, NtrC family, response regulator GlrR
MATLSIDCPLMAPGEYDDETELRREEPGRLARSWPELSWSDEAGTHKCVVTGRTTIGSAPGANVRIADREVSRLHAELEPTDRGTWVRDLGSRNGTFVENLQVAAAMLPDGARIRVGGTDVVLRYPAVASLVELWPDERFGSLIGASTPMRELFAQMSRVAQSDAPVLILGETGTGKELVARAIHDASARAGGPFVIVDCAALASSLIEGELFGHARGAFTGAVGARAGSFEAANGGTIFLDEIGELPLALQPKLLRVLESRTVKRLGESEHRPIDVRLVAATHRDLRRMVNASAFREDLYFRIAVLPLMLPPLRARKSDIPLLFQHFLNGRQTVEPVSPREITEMPWLGNVRELRNFVERACAIGGKDALQSTRAAGEGPDSPAEGADQAAVAFDQPFKEFRERWIDHGEREYLRRLLERHGRNVPAAAEAASLDRTYVYRLIRKHGL